jgi:hypothetical protein
VAPREDALPLTRPAHLALHELRKASTCAESLQQPLWEFAVTLEGLQQLGVSETDLRWLVQQGYVEHAVERTGTRHRQRVFRRPRSLVLAPGSCFVLTAAGAALAAAQPLPAAAAEGVPVPRWDAEVHTLFWGGEAIKCFKGEAACQEAILQAFQDCGWCACVAVCLPAMNAADPKQRLRDAVKNLNRSVRPHLHFRQEGAGARVRWQRLRTDGSHARYPNATQV